MTENGYGKRTRLKDYLRGGDGAQAGQTYLRGGMGMKNYNITEKTGEVAVAKVVDEADDVLLIADDGTMIRMSAAEISIYERATQGVRLMRVNAGAKVISIARTDREEDAPDAAENDAPEE